MKKNVKKIFALSLATTLALSNVTLAEETIPLTTLPFILTSGSAIVPSQTLEGVPLTTQSEVDTAINNALAYFSTNNHDILSNYSETLAILSSNGSLNGYTLPSVSEIPDDEKNMISSLSTKIILLNASGKDPRNFNGRNLVDELIAQQNDTGLFGNSIEYINQHIFAMIALNNANGVYDVEKAIDVLNNYYISTKNYYGGTKLANTFGDSDTTGFAFIALAPFKNLDNAKLLIDGGLTYLHNEQLGDGGFASDTTSEWFSGNSNSNSTGTVISGLIAIGEDVDAWTKNGKTPVDALLTFQNSDGGFFYENGLSNDAFSFNQSLMALGDYKNKVQVYNTIKDQTYKVTKSDLQKEIENTNVIDKSLYTSTSISNLEENLVIAKETYNNELASDDDIYLATSLIRFSLLNLERLQDSNQSNEISVTQEIITSNGEIILPFSTYSIPSGSTVFNVLQKSLAENNIPFEYTGSGNNIYVAKIGNYEEFGQGVNSGFEYYVNGIKKSVSSAMYPVNTGDTLKWIYTTDYTSTPTTPTQIPKTTTTVFVDNIKENYTEISSTLDLSNVNFTLENIYTSYLNKEILSNFEQIFLKYYTGENNEAIISSITNSIEETYRKPTDLAKICLTLQLYDQDITNINGVNLYEKLKNYENLGKQGVNGYIYTLFVATIQNDEDFSNELIGKILSYQNEDGGFSLDLNDISEIDITAMAMQSLAPYKDIQEVNDSLSNALLFTQNAISEDISSESIAQILLALTMLNIDINDEKLVTDKNLLDRLMTFKYTDSGFYHTQNEMYSDDISTEQAALALIFIKNNYENIGEEIESSGANLTRLQFLTNLAIETNLDIDYTLDNVFEDLNDNTLSTYIINTYYNLGITKGALIDGKLYFNPDSLITKQDATVFVSRNFDLPKIYSNVLVTDYEDISNYALSSAYELLAYLGTTVLDEYNNFNPTSFITNYDFLSILKNIQK